MKMNNLKLTLLFVIAINIGHAQQPTGIVIEKPAIMKAENNGHDILVQLIKEAISNSPKLKEQQTAVQIGDIRFKLQESFKKPTLQSEIGVNRIDPVAKAQFGNTLLSFQPNMNYSANIAGNYTLYDWGRQQQNIEKAGLDTEISKNNLSAFKTNLAYQVANIFYSIVFLQNAILVQKDQLEYINANMKMIVDKIKQGDALEYDNISLQVRFRNAEDRLGDLKTQFEKQFIFLNSLIGHDTHNMIPDGLNFDIEKSDIQDQKAEAFKNNADIKNIKIKSLIAEKDLSLAQKTNMPTLGAVAQIGIRNGYLPRINGEIPAVSKDFKLGTLLGIKLSIPIYSGKRGELNGEIAKMNGEMLSQSMEAIRQVNDREIDLAQTDINAKNERIKMTEKNIYQAQYALKLAEVRFKNGIATSLEIEAAQNTLKEAQLSNLQCKFQGLQAELELKRLIGLKFWE